jgi:hypothetical protein
VKQIPVQFTVDQVQTMPTDWGKESDSSKMTLHDKHTDDANSIIFFPSTMGKMGGGGNRDIFLTVICFCIMQSPEQGNLEKVMSKNGKSAAFLTVHV